MSALLIAFFIWLGSYSGTENTSTLWEKYKVEQSEKEQPTHHKNSVEWEMEDN